MKMVAFLLEGGRRGHSKKKKTTGETLKPLRRSNCKILFAAWVRLEIVLKNNTLSHVIFVSGR